MIVHPPDAESAERILESLQSVTCHTTWDGDFVAPSDGLAAFLMGPGHTARDLADRQMDDFYVHRGQRRQALAAVKAAGGEVCSYTVLLRLGETAAFCRCRAIWLAADETYQGTLTRLGDEEIWLPGEIFDRTGWAYFQSDADDHTVYSTPLDARLSGHVDAVSLCGRSRLDTHWADGAEQRRFLEALSTHKTHSDVFRFRHQSGRTLRVRLHGARRGDLDDRVTGYQAIWRDITREHAAEKGEREAIDVTARPPAQLPALERAITRRVAEHTEARWAAFYRRADLGGGRHCHVLRAVYGRSSAPLPPTLTALPDPARAAPLDPKATHPAGPRRWVVPIPSPDDPGEQPALGCFVVDLDDALEPAIWHEAFGRTLALRLEEIERGIADRATSDLLKEGIEGLVKEDPDAFWDLLRRETQRHISADGCSVFVVEGSGRERRLVLRATSGLLGVERNHWRSQVRYAFGQGLTGSVAAHGRPCSVLDVETERRKRSLAPPRFCEVTAHPPQAWLGHPIQNRGGGVVAFVRATNRRVDQDGLIAGFSDADRMLLDRVSTVVRQYSELRALHEEHQDVLARTYHEVQAPLIAIRNKAYSLLRVIENPTSYKKCADIRDDASLLLDLYATIETAAREQKPVVEPVDLWRDILVPLKAGLRAEARRAGYDGITIDAHLRRIGVLRVDRRLIRQVFYNLLVNAIKYGPADTAKPLAVQIESRADRHNVQIVVRDWGMGIEDREARHIFEQFYRSERAIERLPNSTGIGLYVVRRAMEAHKGRILLRSFKGPTEFVLELPIEALVKS